MSPNVWENQGGTTEPSVLARGDGFLLPMKHFCVDDFQKKVEYPKLEEQVLEYWEKTHAFEESVTSRPSDKPYHFYDGPPFATGLPHYGHIVASVMKDVVPRYWTMKGYRVERKWGWDCHGLPVENILEKELNLKTKKDIIEYGVDRFNEACRSTVLRYATEWKKTIRRIGRWVDMENDYKTMDPPFMESVWWVFKQLWNKGLIYKDYKAMHICPRCVTPLSNFEVTQGYKDVTDISVYARFALHGQNDVLGNEPVFAVAWTTTPWTLPGNVLLAVGNEISYVVVRVENTRYLVAKDRVKSVFGDTEVAVEKTIIGSQLVDMELTYEPLFSYFADTEHAFRVVSGDFVTLDEGTGIVHIAPAFGENDYTLGKREQIPLVQHVTMEGKFTKDVVDFAGLEVKPKGYPTKTDLAIVEFLKNQGKVVKTEKITHSYPHCWRCDTPLLNYATSSWFVAVTKIKDTLIANNEAISWVPSHMKEGRFGQWLAGARDWAISRSRYWGTPLPIWESEDGSRLCVGSIAELETLTGKKVTDLHKHKIDDLIIKKEGKTYKRIPDVLDCWFESGSMPYGQMHYPFENTEKFLSSYPAQFIAEGQDQTRGWFYTLHVLATALTKHPHPSIDVGKEVPAFYNVIVNGIVLAEDGKKMSKRLKNYPDPEEVIAKYGADALRYYLLTQPVMEAQSMNFSEKDVRDTYNKIVNALWNSLSFYRLYATDDIHPKFTSRHPLDRWIISRLQHTIQTVTDAMETYCLVNATRPLGEFVTDLSGWYIRRSRDRMKHDQMKDESRVALETLGYVLETFSELCAPFIPFLSELIYQNTGERKSSVHINRWPTVETSLMDGQLELQMNEVRLIVEKILSVRKAVSIPVRQPLASATIYGNSQQLPDELVAIIRDETNIKAIVWDKAHDDALSVQLDTTITKELAEEGRLRELIRTVQGARKEAGCSVSARIVLTLPAEYKTLPEQALDKLKTETLADEILWGDLLKLSIR